MSADLIQRLRNPAAAPNWAAADRYMIEAADALAALTRERDSLRAELDALKAPLNLSDEWPTNRYFVKQVMARFGIGPEESIASALAKLYAAPTPAAADVEALRDALRKIQSLDPATDSDEGHNEWGEADCFRQAQEAARAALAADAGRAPTGEQQ